MAVRQSATPENACAGYGAGREGVMRFVLASWLLFAVIATAAVDPDLPSPAPVVRAIFPHGIQRGVSTEVEISGDNLHDATSIEFAGRGVRAEILSALGSKL